MKSLLKARLGPVSVFNHCQQAGLSIQGPSRTVHPGLPLTRSSERPRAWPQAEGSSKIGMEEKGVGTKWSLRSLPSKSCTTGEPFCHLPREINWILKAQLQEKLILQFLHIDFCLCLTMVPHLALGRAALVPLFQIPEAASHAWLQLGAAPWCFH